jgi:uncharacterized glyoxalase superfamily metalloenzyme YdcJ
MAGSVVNRGGYVVGRGVALTQREQDVYDLLVRHGELATSQVAAKLTKSDGTNPTEALACKYLYRLQAKGRARRRLVTDNDDIHTTWAMWSAL